MSARWVAASGLALAAVLAAVPAPPAASTADQGAAVSLSLDGQAWSDDLDTPLFDPGKVWVPGDVERSVVLVRNDGPSDAEGTATVSSGGAAPLAEALDVRLRAGGEPWRDDGLAPFVIGAGEVVPVDLEVAFSPGAGNDTQDSTASVALSVTLVGDMSPPSTPPGELPRTGVDLWGWIVLAVAALVCGTVLRRSREVAADG